MSFLTRFSLKNAVAVFIMSFLLIFGGLYSFKSLKIDLLPNVEFPQLMVQVVQPGSTAVDMDEQVNAKVEKQLLGVESLKTMNTTSYDNLSLYAMEFTYGTDMEEKADEIRSVLNESKLPDNATPKVSTFSFGAIPIYSLSIFNKDGSDLDKFVNDIRTDLEDVSGVNQVEVSGLKKMAKKNQLKLLTTKILKITKS